MYSQSVISSRNLLNDKTNESVLATPLDNGVLYEQNTHLAVRSTKRGWFRAKDVTVY